MTTETQNTQQNQTSEPTNQPNWIAKVSKGYGKKQHLERVGVAWDREDGGIGIRLAGTQVIEDDIYLYPNQGTNA